jgi:hypothetical protein
MVTKTSWRRWRLLVGRNGQTRNAGEHLEPRLFAQGRNRCSRGISLRGVLPLHFLVDVAARSAIMHEAGTDILAKNFEALQYTDGFRSVEVSMMLSAWSSIRYVSRTEPAFTQSGIATLEQSHGKPHGTCVLFNWPSIAMMQKDGHYGVFEGCSDRVSRHSVSF